MSIEATSSSIIDGHLGIELLNVECSSSFTSSLENVFAETVLLGSNDEDEEIAFEYG